MNLVLNFLWVLLIEYIQNLPFILGILFAWYGLKKGQAWWKWLLILLAGNYGCAVFIIGLDWIKLLATTLSAGPQELSNALRIGTIFTVASGLLIGYYVLTGQLKKPVWADVVFGVSIGVLVAVAETLGDIAPSLIFMHALGFATASTFLIDFIRRSAEAASVKVLLFRVGWITLAMSVCIIIFDYAPHLRGG